MRTASEPQHRGREADAPRHIPAAGWKDVALRVKDRTTDNHLSIIAAGVAFYLLLAMVPALAALVAMYGLFADPREIGTRVTSLAGVLPREALELLEEQLQRLVATSGGALGLGAALGVLLSVWSATRGTKALIDALNVAYDERESRGFVRLNLIAIGLTMALVGFVAVALALVALVPLVLEGIGLGAGAERALSWARWPLLAALLVVALAVLYRYAPDRDAARWRWVSPGAVIATLLWLAGSAGFSLYVSMSDGYHASYGSLGAVAVVMMWLFVGAFAIVLGAQFNAEAERQTRRDSTDGPPRPIGARGAHAADTLGPTAAERR